MLCLVGGDVQHTYHILSNACRLSQPFLRLPPLRHL